MSDSKKNRNLTLSNGSHPRSSAESKRTNKFDPVNSFEKFKRRWKPAIAVFLLTVGATLVASNLLKTQYRAQGKLLYKSNPATNLTDIGEEGSEFKSLPNNQIPLLTQKEIISKTSILQETIDILNLKDQSGNPMQPKYLKQKLDVRAEKGSDVITITYKDQDSHNAANIVNTLMDVYLKEEIRSSKSQTVNADSFLNNQIPQVENNLKKYESILQEFRAKNNILDLQEEKKILVNELGEINSQIASVGADVQGTKAQTSALQSQLGLDFNQAITINQLGNSPTIQSVLTQLAETESELAEERKRFKETHPTITSLLDKKASLNRYLQQTISSKVGRKVKVSDGLLYNGNSVKQTPLDRFITLKIQELSQQTQLASLYEYQKVYLQRAKE
ncbi:MAG: capsular biosynthesis protein, partial [Xenococcaceae cyanobacterium MO_167.B52]|nr:capsular biosynthesis protein [Xenococcaceae cyanobacterium MO_167.B52]